MTAATAPAKVDEATRREIERVFASQQEYRWTAKNTSAEHRKAMLSRLKDAIIRHADGARDALYADLGKPPEEPMMLEAATVVGDIDEALEQLDEWMRPIELEPSGPLTAPGSKVEIMLEGRGVCLLFGPWNFPYQLVFAPLVPIIAAGNTAIVKPNELAPACSALIAKIIRECYEEHEVAVFEGGVDLAETLLELPVDHIFFTGSPKVATTVMTAAAQHLASVTLELGGKCPAIVDETTDLAQAAAQVAFGKHYNSGQICLSPDHVWVKEELRDEFVEHYLGWVKRNLYTEDGQFNRAAMAHMIDGRNFERVRHYIDDAKARGATVVGTGDVHAGEQIIEPTVLLDVPLDADVMRDEIFGPVLPVLTYKDVDDITSRLNSVGKPLAMYLFSQDDDFVTTVLTRTSSGGVTVNGWAVHYTEKSLPFGGIGTSGYGRYHGYHGFKELSHERSIVKQPEIHPPY
jgi:aldehyde dehydrogenase (NAD+)